MSERSEQSKREEEVLSFWNEQSIFEKTLQKESPEGEFIFYDGPPFATGLPHYGHMLASTLKDAIPRYKTMRGYHVPRRWGWDCHGLPLEAKVEEKLGITSKQEILEEVGIEKFVETAKEEVLRYRDDWMKIIPRLGRFVDMKNDYRTMDSSYTESVWWAFKRLHDKGLIYKGFKSLHLSPVLGTELSNIEVAQGYKDIVDFAVTVPLPIKGDDASLLIWTTTPWTLPGNMAAAVNAELTYVTVKVINHEKVNGTYIVAKEKLGLFEDIEHEVVHEQKGSELVGKEYEPPFSYYEKESFKNKENAWKIYAADYVTAEDGTGAVHLAPAFGAEDLELAQKEGVPIVHHIDKNGKFVPEITDFAGMDAKPKDDHQSTDIEIIKVLAHKGKLFKKEKIEHSYPHSWRTDEPLLNYAMDSWFVNVNKIRNEVIRANENVNWVPKEIGHGRFGNWLQGGPDWSISRSRFWGAPLPVWESEKGGRIVIGSLDDLKKHVKNSGNTYLVMRHGEAETNAARRVSDDDSIPGALTADGEQKVIETAKELKAKGVTKIIASPLKRTQQTATIVAKNLGMSAEEVILDERLREIGFGELNGKTIEEYHAFFDHGAQYMNKRPEGGESWEDVKKRVGDLLYGLEEEYKNETILIVTHNSPAFMLSCAAQGVDLGGCATALESHDTVFVHLGEYRALPFTPIPHNATYTLDYHRPYIDSVVLEKDGEEYHHIGDVFDCWFESGSMPYAQKHYPFDISEFEPKPGLFKKTKGYPAQYIAEGLDQTRGWFYSLLVLGVGLFGKSPYENVVVNGMILAEDGRKMSKKLQNYPDINILLDTYGADALRYYLLASPVSRAEDLNFSEDGVKEVSQKVLGRLHNVYTFYELYKDTVEPNMESDHVLDVWVRHRTAALIEEVTKNLDQYFIDKAARPIADFVDDLSTWYVRRSRDRIKNGDEDAARALGTLQYVLAVTSKVLAPFMPFYAEYLFQRVKFEDVDSVHLCAWPERTAVSSVVLEEMDQVRSIVSELLEQRQNAGIKVRQPLQAAVVPHRVGSEAYREIIAEEVNVEMVEVGESVSLNTELTSELRKKGSVREIARAIQSARKQSDLSPHDAAIVNVYTTTSSFVEDAEAELKELTNTKTIHIKDLAEMPDSLEKVSVDSMIVAVEIVGHA